MDDIEDNQNVDSLFQRNRFPDGYKLFFLCLYFPVGCLLVILRLFIGFHAFIVSCILRKCSSVRKWVLRLCRYVLRGFCTILGIFVIEEGDCCDRNSASPVIVANHVSIFDHLALDLLCPCVQWTPWNINPLLQWCFGWADLDARHGRTTLISNAKTFCEESNLPLLIFPEDFMTNGKVGLLKFNVWPFSLQRSIQPVYISLSRPFFANLAPTVIDSHGKFDLFWFLFSPITLFRVRWLESSEINSDETSEQFASRIQKSIANVADLKTTNFTRNDCLEFIKKLKLEQKPPVAKKDNLDVYTTRVKEILPQVPLHVIRKDLERTQSIDATVSNLLEGRTPYTPEIIPTDESKRKFTKPTLLSNNPSSWKFLFEERKREMIAECRLKYLSKKKLL